MATSLYINTKVGLFKMHFNSEVAAEEALADLMHDFNSSPNSFALLTTVDDENHTVVFKTGDVCFFELVNEKNNNE